MRRRFDSCPSSVNSFGISFEISIPISAIAATTSGSNGLGRIASQPGALVYAPGRVMLKQPARHSI